MAKRTVTAKSASQPARKSPRSTIARSPIAKTAARVAASAQNELAKVSSSVKRTLARVVPIKSAPKPMMKSSAKSSKPLPQATRARRAA